VIHVGVLLRGILGERIPGIAKFEQTGETALKAKLEVIMLGVREFAKPFRDRRNRAPSPTPILSRS
jgi:hypothetical protein